MWLNHKHTLQQETEDVVVDAMTIRRWRRSFQPIVLQSCADLSKKGCAEHKRCTAAVNVFNVQ